MTAASSEIRFDFRLNVESSVWWLAPLDLGGLGYEDFITRLGAGLDGEDDYGGLLDQGALIPVILDDEGLTVRARLVLGALNARETEDWVARLSWKLDLRCGTLLAGANADPDEAAELDLADPASYGIQRSGDDALRFRTPVPPGLYRVDLYSYPPEDISGSWARLCRPGRHPEAEPGLDFFKRTRPDTPPRWLEGKGRPDKYLMVLIHLQPLQADEPGLTRPSRPGKPVWQIRKPERFPLGLDDWSPYKHPAP